MIDGVEYGKNIRGLNVVIYDLSADELVDSVVFDYTVNSQFIKLQ